MKKPQLNLLFFLLISFSISAQNWVDKKNNPNENFYSIQQEFNSYWNGKAHERGKGYKAFRRWEWFSEPRVYPSGDMALASKAKAQEEFNLFLSQNPVSAQKISAPSGVASVTGNWSPIGPFGSPAGGDAGRISFIRFMPGNVNTVFVGTGAGGMWVSTNAGASWTTNTNSLAVLGCSDLAIDPTNTNIMYLATGDVDSGDTYSTGILKSTDGGLTWVSTGLTWAVTLQRTIGRLLINPSNPNILLAATSAGIYRTTNGGTTWAVVKTGNYKDMEFKSGDLTNVFAVSGSAFTRSIDGGLTFTTTTTGLPTGGVNRMALSVTPADANYIYVLCSSSADNGFYGLYRSVNGGVSFVLMSSSPNIFGWSTDGSDAGGQGWYDIACGVSPTNKDEIICGGVNSWKSLDGGTSWVINSHWYGGGGNPYVHADLHAVEYLNGSTCYMGTDGGVARTTDNGATWTTINGLMNIAQVTRIGQSSTTANYVISGHQDNGTNLMNGTNWTSIYGGDGSDCFVDWSSNSTLIASYVQGDFQKSVNGGGSFTAIQNGLTGTGAWVAPIMQDPNNSNIFYCGYQQVFKSIDKGNNWTQLGTIAGSSTIYHLAAAPSNTNVLYAARSTSLFKTVDGGLNWTAITTGLPTGSAQISRVAVDNLDANNVFVTFSGYSTGNKVFMSINGGTSWTNISTGLPNLPVNCITYSNNSNDVIYAGTDVGIYVRDNTMTSWTPFMSGLPNVIVNDLEIFYPTGKIRAATYGRGVWESDVYSNLGLDASITTIINPVNGSTTCNTNVTPSIVLKNMGNTTITSVNILYKMDSAATQTLNWTGSLLSAASATINLNLFSGLTTAAHTFSVWLTSPNGSVDQNTANDYSSSTFTVISVPVGVSLPFTEGFEGTTFVPTGWTKIATNTINASTTWTRVLNSTGLTAGSTAVARMDNFSSTVDMSGQIDALRTPALSFATANSTLKLKFDISHKMYSTTDIDSLNIYISIDCGTSWTRLYTKGGTQLATVAGTTTAAYTPTANTQWRRDSLSLSAYAGQPSVYLKFESRSGWGNYLYLDNINVTSVSSAVPVAALSVTATKCAGAPITFSDASTNSPTSWTWSFPGGSPASSTSQNPAVTYTAAGTYTVSHAAANAAGTSTTITQTITVSPSPTISVTTATVCRGSSATISASGATTYNWNTGATTASITVTPTVTTNYFVAGITAGCSDTKTLSVTVKATPTIAATSKTVCTGSVATLTASGATSYTWNTGATTSSITVTPTVATNYTVAGTNTLGCTNTKTLSVTVNALPNVASTSATICAGSTTTLTASGANTYTWNTGTVSFKLIVSPTSYTTYTVTGTSSLGCVKTSTSSVYTNTLPAVTLSAFGPLCVNNAPVTLNGNPTGGIFSGTGVSGNNFDPAVSNTGTFTVTYNYSDMFGCSAIDTKTVSVSLCTGVAELQGSTFSVYPNPAKDVVHVIMDAALISNTTIELYDAIGKLILTEKVFNAQTVISIKTLPKGIYTIRIISADGHQSKRIIKE